LFFSGKRLSLILQLITNWLIFTYLFRLRINTKITAVHCY